ncbi:hypothetical protein [Pseudomonas caspiana]|uniref:Uncharacterized protein n=1 Tax=Pseudomonas caspiana TaxID=1451454 RepID=A0A1Y3PAS8_9PSED|nr:hypothetical protein [Pseudomonas caspiana]OUM75822.1 hypothetical protein AUC60_01570 [Pseudomonas caspiana]
MRLKKSGVVVPLVVGVVISFTFLIIQGRVFDVIAWNYNVCHALFGFTFPFFMSYFSFERSDIKRLALTQTVARFSATRWFFWPLALIRAMGRSIARDFREGVSWKPFVGVCFILAASMANEMWIDPITNGIPFSQAYGNFVADVVGMLAFLAVTYPFSRRQARLRALHLA